MYYYQRRLLEEAAKYASKETEITEVWWKGSGPLSKQDVDGLLDDLESAYKKGGLNGTMKVPNGDSGPVWEMLSGLKIFLRGEPKNTISHIIAGVKKFLKPGDLNSPKLKGLFESLDDDGETIAKDEWGGGFQTSADAHGQVQAGLKADMQRDRARKLKLVVQVIRGEITKQKFKKLTGISYDELMNPNRKNWFINQVNRMSKKALEPVKKEEVEVNEQFKEGDKVKVPHKGKMVSGRIVRYDGGGTDKARQHGGGYVVDVGEYESIRVPPHDIRKESVESLDLDGTDLYEWFVGEEVLYYPNGKKIYSGPEAEKMWREFQSAKGDEMGMPYAS